MNRKIFPFITIFVFITLILANCNLPVVNLAPATPTASQPPALQITPTETQPAVPVAELGRAENPLILALPPAANSQAQIDAAKAIAAQFTQRTGYTVVTIVPDSETALVDALGKNNAHIALLNPYAYELAYVRNWVRASFAVLKEEKGTYGAQFLATRKGGFKSYFNAASGENTEEAAIALAQFAGKKPCWSDETSPSGYVIPLGYLNKNLIITKPPAFVEGHPTVVRSLYASGICDFGATYIDARKFPSLEDAFPDLLEQVIVVWQIPEIIPYDVLAFSTNMPEPMRDLFTSLVPAIMQTEDGNAAFKTAYDIDALQQVNDGYYTEFRTYVQASAVDLTTLIK